MYTESDKKSRILQAAMDIFGKYPFHQVKIEQIAELASVGKGTIYEYFSSKNELFFAIVHSAAHLYFNDIVSSVRDNQDVREKLRDIFRYQLQFIKKHTDIARILLTEGKMANPGFKDMMVEQRRQFELFIAELVQEGIDRGEFRPLDTFIVTQVIIGTLTGLWGTVLFEEDTITDLDEVVDKIIDFCMYGLSGEGCDCGKD